MFFRIKKEGEEATRMVKATSFEQLRLAVNPDGAILVYQDPENGEVALESEDEFDYMTERISDIKKTTAGYYAQIVVKSQAKKKNPRAMPSKDS